MPQYSSLTAELMPGAPGVGRILLNRPDKLNAISEEMPEEIRAAVGWMETQNDVHVILIEGAGRAFCAGYDMDLYANDRKDHPCKQENEPWDPLVDYAFMKRNTENLMSLWRTSKPTIAKVHGYAVGGGRGQRHRAVLRPAGDERRRPHRLHAHAGLGVPHHGHVDVPAGAGARQGNDVHRRHHRRRPGRCMGLGEQVCAGRTTG